MSETYKIIEAVEKYFKYSDCIYVTATKNGVHATNSYHYRGEAVDFGCGDGRQPQQAALMKSGKSRWEVMDLLAAFLYAHSGSITELIHTAQGNHSGWYVKNGRRVSHSFYGNTTDVAHENHVHVAVATVAAANALLKSVSGNIPTPQPGGLTVSEIQTALVKAGFSVAVDGSFGPNTKAAVEAFQKAKGLSVDGIVGPHTTAALKAVYIMDRLDESDKEAIRREWAAKGFPR